MITDTNYSNLTSKSETKKKDVALVLSSGGAKGLAQIGAIEQLEANGDVLVGRRHLLLLANKKADSVYADVGKWNDCRRVRQPNHAATHRTVSEITTYIVSDVFPLASFMKA